MGRGDVWGSNSMNGNEFGSCCTLTICLSKLFEMLFLAPLGSGERLQGKVSIQARQELARVLRRQRLADLGLH